MKNVYFFPKGKKLHSPNFTDECLIFSNCQCMRICMLLCLMIELQMNERGLSEYFGGKHLINLNELIQHM